MSWGHAALMMGIGCLIASCIRSFISDWEKANENEKCAILWFILATLLLR